MLQEHSFMILSLSYLMLKFHFPKKFNFIIKEKWLALAPLKQVKKGQKITHLKRIAYYPLKVNN